MFRLLTPAKSVNNMRLQNLVMQLRKISSHPFLFDWPYDPETNQLVVNDDLVNASGKMLLLNRLLGELFQRGHRVLLFSQFTTMLDVIVRSWEWKVASADCLGRLGDRVQGMGDLSDRRIDLAGITTRTDGPFQQRQWT